MSAIYFLDLFFHSTSKKIQALQYRVKNICKGFIVKHFKHTLSTGEKVICLKSTKRMGPTISRHFPSACWSPSLKCWLLDDNTFYAKHLQKLVKNYEKLDAQFELEDQFNIALNFSQERQIKLNLYRFDYELKRHYITWLEIDDNEVQRLLKELAERYYDEEVKILIGQKETRAKKCTDNVFNVDNIKLKGTPKIHKSCTY